MNKKYHFCLVQVSVSVQHFQSSCRGCVSRTKPGDWIALSIFRFHVLANSDSSEDQAMKLEVKDFLLEKIRTEAGENTGKQELCQYLA